jgi:hypothetical protein
MLPPARDSRAANFRPVSPERPEPLRVLGLLEDSRNLNTQPVFPFFVLTLASLPSTLRTVTASPRFRVVKTLEVGDFSDVTFTPSCLANKEAAQASEGRHKIPPQRTVMAKNKFIKEENPIGFLSLG